MKHYKDLELKVEPTEEGLRIVMTGKTPAAVKIAQNHAQIVFKFVEKGWSEHDREHPAVATSTAAKTAQPESAATCGAHCGQGGACCRAAAKPAAGK